MDDEGIRQLLRESHTVAVVGMSDKPDRDSYQVGMYLRQHGYRVLPVNPAVSEIGGLSSYPSLSSLPAGTEVDLVDVFRRSEAVPAIVEDALALHPRPRAVWLQLTVRSDSARPVLERAGVGFVEDRCIMQEHRRLLGG